MRDKTLRPQIKLLLRMLDEGYDRASWHGPNLRGALRGVTAHEAAWRPAPGRHNIWELIVHAAYWKYAVRRRLRGDKRGSFPHKGSNWFARPVAAPEESAWRQDVMLLEQQHRTLRATVATLPAAGLHQRAAGSKSTPWTLIHGIACHDVYHAGQIQLLKRLRRKGRRR